MIVGKRDVVGKADGRQTGQRQELVERDSHGSFRGNGPVGFGKQPL
jgi:hypothetical protein